MFGFPNDIFSMHGLNNRPANPNNPSNRQQGLFGNSMLMPMPFMGSPFSGMNSFLGDFGLAPSPFAMMDRMMQRFSDPSFMNNASASTTGPVHSFSSTTIMSYGGSDGRPKIYQESTSRTRGPGGLEETRQAVRDSERGINKVQIGHRIGDRKHVVEREMNVETGQISENIELENLDEQETDEFKREWRERSTVGGVQRRNHQRLRPELMSDRLHHRSSNEHRGPLAIEYTGSQRNSTESSETRNQQRSQRHANTLDITEGSPSDDDVQEIVEHRQTSSSSGKRKAPRNSSNDGPSQRKHRPNRS